MNVAIGYIQPKCEISHFAKTIKSIAKNKISQGLLPHKYTLYQLTVYFKGQLGSY